MKLTFLGTRGNIEPRSERHYMHSALLVEYHGERVLVECGEDWRSKIDTIGPEAIVLTHTHPDHAWSLKDGAPCPVHATKETWDEIASYPIEKQTVVEPRAPAVGYRIGAGRYRDVLSILDAGLPSTVVPKPKYRTALRQLLARMASPPADVAVVEIGASPLELYNGAIAVEALSDAIAMTVLCASDPYAVLGLQDAFGMLRRS